MYALNSRFTVNQDVENYVTSVKNKAEALVRDGFPQKIVTLNNLLESKDFCVDDPTTLHQALKIPIPVAEDINRANTNTNSHDKNDSKKRKYENSNNSEGELQSQGTKVYIITSGVEPCNKKITRLIDLSKPFIRQLVEDTNLLKMWLTFLIPKIEDGNNFGVSIQEDTLGEIRTVEAEAATFYEQISRYYITRGKIISKVAKYPHIDDYRVLIEELDEKEFLSLKIVISEIRNHYCSLYDIILKNLEKLIRPRSSNAENLY